VGAGGGGYALAMLCPPGSRDLEGDQGRGASESPEGSQWGAGGAQERGGGQERGRGCVRRELVVVDRGLSVVDVLRLLEGWEWEWGGGGDEGGGGEAGERGQGEREGWGQRGLGGGGLLKLCGLLEGARELHLVDSSLALLAGCMFVCVCTCMCVCVCVYLCVCVCVCVLVCVWCVCMCIHCVSVCLCAYIHIHTYKHKRTCMDAQLQHMRYKQLQALQTNTTHAVQTNNRDTGPIQCAQTPTLRRLTPWYV
jgi:hypothetical protein